MKPILVPVDATPASRNAAFFAIDWAKNYGYDHIILFNTFYESMFEYLVVASAYTITNMESLNDRREEAEQQLHELRDEMLKVTAEKVTVSISLTELPLLRGLLKIVQSDTAPSLIILGSGHHGDGHKGFITNHIIPVAKLSPVKVLIVPVNCSFRPVKNILVPYDASTPGNLGKLDRIKGNANLDEVHLLILNISNREEKDVRKMEDELHDYLAGISHDFFHINNKDIIGSILSFEKEKNTDLVIALPGKHSFLYPLTHKSISEAIYRNANNPVLILK